MYIAMMTTDEKEPENSLSTVALLAGLSAGLVGAVLLLCLLICCTCGAIWKVRRTKTLKDSACTQPNEERYVHYSAEPSIHELDSSSYEQNEPKQSSTSDGSDEQSEFDVPDPTYAVADSRRVMVKKGSGDKELVDGTATHSPYVEIVAHQHEAQVYAHVELRTPDQVTSEDKVDTAQVEYAVLDHGKLVDKVDTGQEPIKEEAPLILPPKPTPLNSDTLHAILSPAANKWYEIGLVMGLSKHTLESDIYRGNSTDWLRLGEVCGLCGNSLPGWEEVVHIMWEVEEWEIADKICRQESLQVVRPETQGVKPPSLPPKVTEVKT